MFTFLRIYDMTKMPNEVSLDLDVSVPTLTAGRTDGRVIYSRFGWARPPRCSRYRLYETEQDALYTLKKII